MSWIKDLLWVFQKPKCEKLVEYQKRSIVIKGLSGGIPSVASIELGELTLETKQVHSAAKVAMILDDYQVLACKDLHWLPRETKEWMDMFKFRSAVILLITEARIVFEAFQADPANQAKQLNRFIKKMQSMVDSAVSEAIDRRSVFMEKKCMMPGKSEGTRPMPDKRLKVIDMKPTSLTLKSIGIDEGKLNLIIKKL
jgi:hypothetical protein